MTANGRNGADQSEPLLFADAEAVAASGMPLPSLRVLQAAGAIQARKTPKPHGGFRRLWREEDILIAAVGAAICTHFAWNIRIAAEVMSKTRPGTWSAQASAIAGTMTPDASSLMRSTEDDWHLDLIDRRFLFLRLPPLVATLFPDAPPGQRNLLLGLATSKDTFQLIPWSVGFPAGRSALARKLPAEQVENAVRVYRVAMACHAHALSTASINISLPARAAWRRLRGLDVRFLQDALP